ncbi:sperm flagellar protein 2-like [Dendronephthya gigantea]|uniref:sperm flagellar protein 2-like n=1 Tax=Dendronephthya gigantea TaxID=151771 RepID=UPI00106C9114|nr:sperm flagellar protein 2-like [Dendronephthya gigantea]
MTDIICRWLNDDVKLSLNIEKENVSKRFSSGYLFGEILYKYGLQDDFSSFSEGRTADSKLNNFTRIESVMKLLEIPYDTNVAKSIMNENHGAATKLLYQLFIALGRKAKKNLTGVAMETMRPSAPVKLESIESLMHKERLKQLVPRQVDVNFETLVERYQSKQRLQEEMVVRAKHEEERKVRQYQQDLRQRSLEKSRHIRDKQNEVMQKIRDAQVRIPKPPESKKSAKTKQESRKEREIQEVKDHISSFEESMRTNLPQQSSVQFNSEMEGRQDLEFRTTRKPLEPISLKTAGDDYVSKIKKRLNEDAVARKEREKRRRRVLIEQLKAHESQEEQRREEMLVKRLMRQSQQEKRIAVQLMQIRHEKQVIKENRIFREKQYAERRLKDFEDALNQEAEMCRLAQIEYRDQIKKTKDEREQLLEERRKQKYEKHYNICEQILSDIVDLSCKIGEYRELTEGNVPEKLFREWKGYFDASLPLYPHEILTEEEIKRSHELLVEEEKNKLTDESDFIEYRGAVGEWEPNDESLDHVLPKDNPILGHIVQKLFNIISPPEPPPPTPEFPPFPVKACFLGKFFSGKTTAVQRLVASHRVVRLCIDDLVQEAIEAYQTGETREEIIENNEPQNERCLEDKPSAQAPETTTSDQAYQSRDETKENEDPNNATATENVEAKDCGDAEGNENELEEENKRYYVVRKTTSRAILGEKAYEYLRKGKQIQDQLLVDITVEAIRQVPAGTGWILDGFPSTISQAKILEKSLTGYDATKDVKTKETKGKGKKSRIAPDPNPAVESPPPKSGIDIVVLFDVSDDVVLTRAEGRTYDPTNSEIFHQEFNPPVDGSYTGLGKQEKVRPVIDPSNDREQVQQRITGFDDSWSKLEKWFNKFGILSKVDVDNSIDNVYESVASLLVTTTERIQGPIKEVKSEEVTNTAIEVIESTPVNDSVDVVNTDEPKDATSHEDVEDTKETPNTKTVSPKASKKMSKKDRSPSPPSKAVSPKSSKKNLRPGSKRSSPSPSRKPSKVKSPTASRTDAKRAKSPVKKQDVPEELPVEPVVPPGPEPGSKEWEYVDQPIEMPLVEVLASRWENLEKTYIDTAKNVFREIRLEREVICRYFYSTRKEFLSFLRRPDEKEEYVLQWQSHYNDVPEDMRSDDEVKAELHQKVDDLCDRLYSICDNRKEIAENERKIVMEEGWLQDRLGLLTNHYLTLMQVEVDRYQDTYRLLKDYYNSAEGKNPIEAYSDICRVPLVDLPPIVPTIPSSSSEHGSQHEVKQTSSKKDRENIKTPEGPTSEGEDHRSRIPLVPRRPKSGDVVSTKEKKDKRSSKEKRDKGDNQSETPVLPSDPDERLVFDGYYHALGIIDTLVRSVGITKRCWIVWDN